SGFVLIVRLTYHLSAYGIASRAPISTVIRISATTLHRCHHTRFFASAGAGAEDCSISAILIDPPAPKQCGLQMAHRPTEVDRREIASSVLAFRFSAL